MKKTIIGIIILIIIALGLWYAWNNYQTAPVPVTTNEAISSFDECAVAGYPIMESYPEKCQTESGQVFVRDIGNELEKQDLIKVDNPRPNQIIASPLTITGQARGYWFFEASFPVVLLDEDGRQLASGIAQADGDWMTEDFVPFKAELSFGATQADKGVLILAKDNPSGLPANDDELQIPVEF